MKIEFLLLCLKAAVKMIPRNLIMCFSTLLICMVLGMLIALVRTYRVPVLAPIFDMLMALCKAFPANLVLLICIMTYSYKFADVVNWLHLDINIKDVNLIYVAIVGLTIVALPGISDVLRSGLIAIPRGQFEAGYAIGMTSFQTFRDIIFPQMFRVIIPPLTNSTLSLMKTTALVYVMGVADILSSSTNAAFSSSCYLEAYTAAAIVFWIIGAIIEKVGAILECEFSKSVKQIA